MAVDLKKHFEQLKADIDDILIKRQNQESKLNRTKETIKAIVPLFDRGLREQISLYKKTLSVELITLDEHSHEWLFRLDKLNYSVTIRLFIDKTHEANMYFPESKIDFIYFIKDYKFVKIAHKDIFYNDLGRKSFEDIDESKIQCILSVDDFVTEILNEVIYNFRLKIEETRKVFYDSPFV